MKKVNFSITCMAMYNAELDVEDSFNEEEILNMIHEKLNTFPAKELIWLEDLEPEEAVTMDDIRYIIPITE